MKEIITEDPLFERRYLGTCHCPWCGRLFKYDESDVELHLLPPEIDEETNLKTTYRSYSTRCPACDWSITLRIFCDKEPWLKQVDPLTTSTPET